MYRFYIFFLLVFVSAQGFTQQNDNFRVIGRVPNPSDNRLYQLQVGFFRNIQLAENVIHRLADENIVPSFETDGDYTRVVINDLRADEVPSYLSRIRSAGIPAVFIRLNGGIGVSSVPPPPPVSDAVLPARSLTEIANRTIRTGETINLTDSIGNRNVEYWMNSSPSVIRTDNSGNVTGMEVGNGFISINNREYIAIAVVPREDFFVVPETMSSLLPPESNAGHPSTTLLTEYTTEPTFRLSYRFVNQNEHRGASGTNGGIDIMARGPNYEWLWTTYQQGGWFYDLNGVKRVMIDGFQRDASNGVELSIKPEFVYNRGVPYLQLRHILYNPNNFSVTGQRFGATADVMIHNNDRADLIYTEYGAYMADSSANPTLELMFIGTSGEGITPVDTLWLGGYSGGRHLDEIYTNRRENVRDTDSAIAFSYQNIDLGPRESREFIIRFTLARSE